MKYIVKWEIELDADDPQEAAKTALAWLNDNEGGGHIFTTKDENDECHSVDLDEDCIADSVLPLTLDQFHEQTLNSK